MCRTVSQPHRGSRGRRLCDACPGCPRVRVEIVYATAEAVSAEVLDLPDGTPLGEAVKASRFASTPAAAYAVFGKVATDRIELLRELVIDPKAARRKRAGEGIRGNNP
ncbi:MAG: RnfH family protein [Pseudomonadales bacterium]|nr:RnfH family protein [Pseudomonadales bacterium]